MALLFRGVGMSGACGFLTRRAALISSRCAARRFIRYTHMATMERMRTADGSQSTLVSGACRPTHRAKRPAYASSG